MPEHIDISRSNIHEPKEVELATAGDVYVADGAGSGDWATAPGEASRHRGTIVILGNSTAESVTKATDSTLKTPGDYQTLESYFTAPADNNLIKGMVFSAGKLVVAVDGVYAGRFWTSCIAAGTDIDVSVTPMVNGTALSATEPLIINRAKVATDINNMSGFGAATLFAGDEITMSVAATSSAAGPFDITLLEASFSLVLLEEL
jgi:hypothetical protein